MVMIGLSSDLKIRAKVETVITDTVNVNKRLARLLRGPFQYFETKSFLV